MADMLRQLYYLRQIYYGRCITADRLRRIHCVQQTRPYLDKRKAPEALDCCIRICLLQHIAPMTPLDRFIMYTSRTEPCLNGHEAELGETQRFQKRVDGPQRKASAPRVPVPGYPCIYIYIYIIYKYVHIYTYILAGSRSAATSRSSGEPETTNATHKTD